jgi:hypothetical protein
MRCMKLREAFKESLGVVFDFPRFLPASSDFIRLQ